MRKYLQDRRRAVSAERLSRAVDYATTFANRINFGEAADSIRYGDAHVERFFLRGVGAGVYRRRSRCSPSREGRFISQYDEEHARNVVVIGRPSPIRCFRTSIRSARRCG